MKPRIRAYSDTYKEWARPFTVNVFWGSYTIQSNFKKWSPNNNISISAEEQYKQNKANYPDFVISEPIESLFSRLSIQ